MAMELVGEALKIAVFGGLVIAGILVVLIWKKNKTTRMTFLRFVIQMAAFVGLFYLFSYPLWLLLMLLTLLAMTIVLGRFFCGWLCPFAFFMDLLTAARKVTRIDYKIIPERINVFLHRLRYLLLVFFLLLPFLLTSIDPGLYSQALFFVGPFYPLHITLAPVVQLVVPWKGELVIGNINLSYPYVQVIMHYTSGNLATIAALAFVTLTILGALVFRRFWCRFCPTGVSLAIVNRFKGFRWAPVLHISKDEQKCTKCGICKRVCPVQVTEVYEKKGGKIGTSMCTLCFRCVEMCPEQSCLKVNIGKEALFKSRNWLEPSKSK